LDLPRGCQSLSATDEGEPIQRAPVPETILGQDSVPAHIGDKPLPAVIAGHELQCASVECNATGDSVGSNRFAGPTPGSACTPRDGELSEEDEWITQPRGCKGQQRPNCRLCSSMRFNVPCVSPQRGNLCFWCNQCMQQDGRRRTEHLRDVAYRRAVRTESVRRRQHAGDTYELPTRQTSATCLSSTDDSSVVVSPDRSVNPTRATVLKRPAASHAPSVRKRPVDYDQGADNQEVARKAQRAMWPSGSILARPAHLFISPQKGTLCAVHALSNASQDKGGHCFTQELLIKGANAAARRLGEHVSRHMDTKQAGDFSIEALCDAVSLTNRYTMTALSPQLDVLRDSPPQTVLGIAFDCIRGLPVVGLLVHLPSGHYVALRRDSAVAPLSGGLGRHLDDFVGRRQCWSKAVLQ
jgi:hypothetical protein